tara:strand:+ start:4332 stop:6029 length:1698 start_codon:yes stop_codon:yes gene_type:complete
MSFWDELAEQGFSVQNLQEGQNKTTCPQCSPQRKNKSDPCLSMSIDHDGAQWRCHHCDWEGNVWRNKMSSPFKQKTKKKSPPAVPKLQAPSDGVISWFAQRKISQETVELAGVESGTAYIGGRQENAIAFVHKDSDGKTINVKFRTKDKKFTQIKDGERLPYLWNMINRDNDELIITEGEVDCLSLIEAGFSNVVSVPDGASDKKLQWIDDLQAEMESFKRIVLLTDGDAVGIAMRNELARRLGRHRCWRVEWPEGCKDPNDVLVGYGVEKLVEFVKAAEPWPLKALHETKSFADEAFALLHGEVKQGSSTGIRAMDFNYRIRPGELTIISGAPGVGKSEFLDQICLNMAKEHEWRFAVCSFENPVDEHINKLAAKYVRKPAWHVQNGEKMNSSEWKQACEFIQNRFYWIRSDDEAPTVEWCLQNASACVQRYPNVRGLVLDPYNEFEHRRPSGWTETEYVSQMLASLKRWAATNECSIFLVAHPAKLRRNADGTFPVPEPYDIAGSANFYNKADNILIVERDFTEGSNDIRIHVKKIRFKQSGRVGTVELKYEYVDGTYRSPEV